MLRRFRELADQSFTDDIRGATVYGQNDEKLGTIDDIVFDTDESEAGFAVVDSGGWLTSRKFLIPANHLRDYPNSDKDFYLPASKDELRHLPEFDESLLDSPERFRSYRSRWEPMWKQDSGRRHRRVESISNRMNRDRVAETDRDRMARTDDRDIDRPGVPSEYSNPTLRSTPITSTTSTSPSGNVAVYGVFHDRDKVRETVETLKNEGFRDSDISVVFPNQDETKQFAVEHNTKAPEGATAGGVTGIVAGGVLGWMAGIGMIAIPGIGPLLAAGPIVAALAGAGAVGAAGGLVGALIGMGVPEYEAKKYENDIKEGRILIAVHCSDIRFTHSVRDVLNKAGAQDIYVSGSQMAA